MKMNHYGVINTLVMIRKLLLEKEGIKKLDEKKTKQWKRYDLNFRPLLSLKQSALDVMSKTRLYF